ncbi:hypothetical protein B0T25DRAFT_626588 [Lasiosphaeria hispida]|uniref:Uncharacterized protein n=1 Tax=Lasiosphaeria hispida TaxID=260671 RepID=A0AAJ0H5T1_9PEZI|nr:hypothetical protein B0T25DRAFT_626588 [Lasiosphaeria hispida]
MAPIDTLSIFHPSVPTLHKTPYPAISPLRPELSQAGRTVLIAGGSTGIGFAIARAYVQAKASRVILLGRREDVLKKAAATLASEAADKTATTVDALVCDAADLADSERVWGQFKKDGVLIDVLVLNAATTGAVGPILQTKVGDTWRAFEVNVRMLLDFTQRFYNQEGPRKKYLVNISSSAIHSFDRDATMIPAYGLTKNSGTLLLQQIAKDVDRNDMQIVSYHPGGVYTELAESTGVPKELYDWDDENLAGQFGVWAATDDAAFLHGRFIPAHWDIDEVKKSDVATRIGTDKFFLKIGVIGVTEVK